MIGATPASVVNEWKRRMATTEEAAQEGMVPEDTKRAAVRGAIAARKGANARYQHLEAAVTLAREVCSSSQRVLLAFSDVDAAIVQHRAEEFKRVAGGGSLAVLGLPEYLATRRTMRDVAAEQLTRARETYEDLVADVAEAKAAMEQAALDVAKVACAVLLEEGAMQGFALEDAWRELWRQFDRVAAFADCQIHYADTSFSITLPPETASLLQTLAKMDGRESAHQDHAANAGEAWCLWFKELLGDAGAKPNFHQTPCEVHRVSGLNRRRSPASKRHLLGRLNPTSLAQAAIKGRHGARPTPIANQRQIWISFVLAEQAVGQHRR